MPNWFALTYKCEECGEEWDDYVDRAEKDKPVPCKVCGGKASRKFESPLVMNASYPDGRNKYKDYKESTKLTKQMYSLPPSERQILKNEIDKLRGVKK